MTGAPQRSSRTPAQGRGASGSRQLGCLAASLALHAFVLGGMALTRFLGGDLLGWVFCVPLYLLAALALAVAGVRGNRAGPAWVGAVHIALAVTAAIVTFLT